MTGKLWARCQAGYSQRNNDGMFFQFESQKRDEGQNEDCKRTERYLPKLILNITCNIQIKPTDIMFNKNIGTHRYFKCQQNRLRKTKEMFFKQREIMIKHTL